MTPPDFNDSTFDALTWGVVRDALRELATTRSTEVVYANPVLLSARWQAVLRERQEGESPAALDILAQMEGASEALRKAPWPLGKGPLDALFVQVDSNEMTAEAARARATETAVYQRLSPPYVRRMCTVAEKWAREGDWRRGVLLAELVLRALDARREALAIDQAQMEFIATVHWLDVATRAASDLPDGRIFHDAAARGARLADVIDDPDGYYHPASILHGLGILHLDPFVGGRSSDAYDSQVKTWHQRFRDRLRAENVNWDDATMRVPEPAQALVQAADCLGRAAGHRSGEQKGWTLKARLQALVWQRRVGGDGHPPAREEVKRVGEEAAKLLDKPEQVGARTDIANLLAWYGREADATDTARAPLDVAALLATPLERWRVSMLPDEVIETYLQAAAAIEDHDPRTAFRLWSTVQTLGWAQDETRRLQFQRRALGPLARVSPMPSPPDTATSLAADVARLQAGARGDELALGLLALALRSAATDQEEAGLVILETARQADAAFADRHATLIDMMHASLLVGAAVDRFEGRQFEDAARFYMASARAYLACDCPVTAFGLVRRVIDLVDKGSEEAMAHFIVGIGDLAPLLEQRVPGAAESLQASYRTLMANFLRQGEAKAVMLLLLVERAKGNAFTRALIRGTPLAWLESDTAREMASRVDELRRAPGATDAQAALEAEFELVLGAFTSPFEQVGGDNASERLRNVMIAFDDALSRAQMAIGAAPQWVATDRAVRAALGPRSALLALYVGQGTGGNLAVYLMLLSNEAFELRVGQLPAFPSTLITMSIGGARVAATPFAPWVASLRQAIQEEPLTRKVSARAAVALEEAAANLLGGGLRERLRALHAEGKNHLCVWAHGPFHFLPFHLLGAESAPLADDWNVTTLPSLQLLDPARRRTGPTGPFMAVGLDFSPDNARGLPALSGAEAEAREVADAMHAAAPLVGEAVDKTRVLDALRTHERVHIATHGELPVSAPAFQALYLGTRENGDVLHAHEILGLDLRHVDLVTLSACETSLGRLDVGDNLRGFSANLLVAGVSTIIGTLWSVETRCARYFFTRLYTELCAGATKGTAFRTAQRATRARFPKHRDWGAFYLSGAVD